MCSVMFCCTLQYKIVEHASQAFVASLLWRSNVHCVHKHLESLLQDLLCITGSIDTASGDLEGYNVFKKALQSAHEHDLKHEILTGDEVNARFPGYDLPSNFMVSSCICMPSVPNLYCSQAMQMLRMMLYMQGVCMYRNNVCKGLYLQAFVRWQHRR